MQTYAPAAKSCTGCQVEKPLTDFYRQRGGYFARCKTCVSEDRRARYASDGDTLRRRVRDYQQVNPEKVREAGRRYRASLTPEDHRRKKLRQNYGMTPRQWDAMFAEQGGACAICGTAEPGPYWCTDHDHVSGIVRGILCWHCNVGLGHFRDDRAALNAAIEYLQRTEVRHGDSQGAAPGGEARREGRAKEG